MVGSTFLFLVFKLRLQDADDIIDGFLFEIGAFQQFLLTQGKDALGRVAADIDKNVDNPLVNLVGELLQIHIIAVLVTGTVDIDFIAYQLAG